MELYDRIYPDNINQDAIVNITLHVNRYNFALRYAIFGGITLDAGCGCGYGSRMLTWVSQKVIAVDQSEHAIQHAKQFYPQPRIEWRIGDIRDITENNFDTIIGFEVLEHITNTEITLAHLMKLLKPNGRGIFSIPLNSNAPGHLRVFNEQEAINLFKPYKHFICYQYDRDVTGKENKPPAFIIAVIDKK
jgi:2-polyprenyl-3-methyl-5-hydroxy-6-metoxy-1,4-benzoquinol methylase